MIFKLAADGFRPELELDKKQLHFDKVLIHRSVAQLHFNSVVQPCFDKALIYRSEVQLHFNCVLT